MIGTIIGMMAIGRAIGSLSSGVFLNRVTTKVGMSFGLITMGICIAGLGALDYFSSAEVIVIVALTLRIIQGIMVGIVLCICFGTLANDYPNTKDRLIALNALFAGVAPATPGLGLVMFAFLGYSGTCYAFGGITIFTGILAFIFFPNSIFLFSFMF